MKNIILVSTKRSYEEEGKAKVHESWAIARKKLPYLKYIVNDNGWEAKPGDRPRKAWKILDYGSSSYNPKEWSFKIEPIEDVELHRKVVGATLGSHPNSGVVYFNL